MIDVGFCNLCGRRFDADPDREHNDINHTDCFEKLIKVTEEYLNFGDECRKRLGIQCQYGSRYVDGAIPGWPNLGKGIRFKGNTNMYHSLRIHRDDVDEFFGRIENYLYAD